HDLLSALKRRMELVEEVAMSKLENAYPFRDRQREEQLLLRIRHMAADLGLDAHEVERLYRAIVEMAISHQQAHIRNLEDTPLRVAYQGVEGSYSHLTAQRHYQAQQGGVLLTGYETFRGAAEAVKDGSVDVALLPVENSTAGSINQTYDLLAEGGLVINAEVISQVEHCLLALPGATIEGLRTVISHPQALMQCETFLQARPWIEPRAEFDTAGAARKVSASNDLTLAAIASESAGRAFGLEVLASRIQSQQSNYTRFVEVALEAAPCPPDVPCKTSLLLITAHKPGALGEVIVAFARRGVNLTKLESRPIPAQPFDYQFYLDIEGHAASEAITETLREIEHQELTRELRILGTYPRASRDG
ncbi:MAG: bifunctional chorismate mutase/prephenate dehydratase, partial [Thermoanaerobaculia bacterium]|nr:bifunctional chorismate mutase/prephenate dehydratase [Thermoanaerobaculia bacterium]